VRNEDMSFRPSVCLQISCLKSLARLQSTAALKNVGSLFLWSVFLRDDPIFTPGGTFLFFFTAVVDNKK